MRRTVRTPRAEGGRRKAEGGRTLPSPLSPPPSSRRGLTLLEVLVSMGILTIGLLAVASLIPIGKLAMTETNKADRTGMCGRAALREIKVRRMLDQSNWQAAPGFNPFTPFVRPFVIDPLGCANGLNATNVGGSASTIQRISLNNVTSEDFRWHDDLIYDPSASTLRPRPVVRDANGRVGPYPSLPSETPALVAPVTPLDDGNFSWFVTAQPSPNDGRQFSVSVAVCWKRAFTTPAIDSDSPGETVIPVVCDATAGFGGIGISYPGSSPMPKENEWVLLTNLTKTSQTAAWYRVVAAGTDNGTNTTRVSLVGPDWNGYDANGNPGTGGTGSPPSPDGSIKLIVIKGVTGVYTTTIELDNDGIWSK
jgi:prepilin-type N-terminal cleavage/methylation domain-containing protein